MGKQKKKNLICVFYNTTGCKFTEEECLGRHVKAEEYQLDRKVCYYFAERGRCKDGDKCAWSHDLSLLDKGVGLSSYKLREKIRMENLERAKKTPVTEVPKLDPILSATEAEIKKILKRSETGPVDPGIFSQVIKDSIDVTKLSLVSDLIPSAPSYKDVTCGVKKASPPIVKSSSWCDMVEEEESEFQKKPVKRPEPEPKAKNTEETSLPVNERLMLKVLMDMVENSNLSKPDLKWMLEKTGELNKMLVNKMIM